MRRLLLIALFVMLAVGLGIQAVPYGRQHTNPPVLAEPNWDDVLPDSGPLRMRVTGQLPG